MYHFENYSLDIERRELRRASELVPTEPQVFDILHYLVRHRNRVVTKDDLMTAVWHGRIVSDSTLSSRVAAVRRAVGDCGKDQRLIRTIVSKGLRFVANVREHDLPRTLAMLPDQRLVQHTHGSFDRLPRRLPPHLPTIAVLPFANLTGDSAQQCLIEGIREDLTVALTQFRWLSVVGHMSRSTSNSQVADARESGIHYVLDGAVRTGENRVRITARLIDATTGVHLWARQFDESAGATLDLMDKVSATIVGATEPKLEQAEIARAKRTPPESLDSYRCYLLGMSRMYQWTKDGIDEALRIFQQAIQIDPDFAPAYGMAAYCYVQRQSYGWLSDRPRETAESSRLARQAAELGSDDAVTLTKAAHAISSLAGDLDSGIALIEQALRSNPHLAAAWYVSAWLRLFLGEPGTATEHLGRAMTLSPSHPLMFKMHSATAYAHFFRGHYDQSATAAEIALRTRPNYLTAMRAAAVSHALAGRMEKARSLMARMRRCDANLRMSNLPHLLPFHRPADVTRWQDALHKAGLPD